MRAHLHCKQGKCYCRTSDSNDRLANRLTHNKFVEQSPYNVVVQRVAPLGTLWIFCVVRLDLLPACISLAIVAVFVQQSQLKIVFD